MYQRNKQYWLKKYFVLDVLTSLFFLLLAFFANQYANIYLSSVTRGHVTDLILDNLPAINVSVLFSEGAVTFVIILLAVLLYEPKYIPVTLKAVGIFFIVRSFFMILTHLAPPLNEIYIDPTDYIRRLSSGYDLFFSAHTGLPFLLGYIFWNKIWLRYFFFICSIIAAAVVLLGHLHYSIDVFSAFFIAFGIYHICKYIFPKDFELIA